MTLKQPVAISPPEGEDPSAVAKNEICTQRKAYRRQNKKILIVLEVPFETISKINSTTGLLIFPSLATTDLI